MVPILSALKRHIDILLTLKPCEYMKCIESHHEMVAEVTEAESKSKTSILSYIWSITKRDMSTKEEKPPEEIFEDKRITKVSAQYMIYKFTPLLFFPPFGMLVLGLTIAWNNLPFEPYQIMTSITFYGTVMFQLLFFVFTVSLQDMNSILNYIDLIFIIIGVASDIYWVSESSWGHFSTEHMVYYSILMVYMIIRSWSEVINYNINSNPIAKCNRRRNGPFVLEHLRFVWITRDSSSVSQIFPDVEALWNKLCNAWGVDRAREFCKISIYCTTKDEKSKIDLEEMFQSSNLILEDALRFERPSIQDIIIEQSTKRINNDSLKVSRTLFAFCGSSTFASTIKQQKLLNDVALYMTDQTHHQVDLIVESFGQFDKRKKCDNIALENTDDSINFSLTSENNVELILTQDEHLNR